MNRRERSTHLKRLAEVRANQKRYERLAITLVVTAIEGEDSRELLALTQGFEQSSLEDALISLITGVKGE